MTLTIFKLANSGLFLSKDKLGKSKPSFIPGVGEQFMRDVIENKDNTTIDTRKLKILLNQLLQKPEGEYSLIYNDEGINRVLMTYEDDGLSKYIEVGGKEIEIEQGLDDSLLNKIVDIISKDRQLVLFFEEVINKDKPLIKKVA